MRSPPKGIVNPKITNLPMMQNSEIRRKMLVIVLNGPFSSDIKTDLIKVMTSQTNSTENEMQMCDAPEMAPVQTKKNCSPGLHCKGSNFWVHI